MAVRAQDMVDEDGEVIQGTSADAEKVIYTLHPNCVFEEV